MLAGEEFTEINAENIKLIIDQLKDKFWWFCLMMELILDHGSEFGAHRIHDDGSWNREFKDHLKNMAPSYISQSEAFSDEREVRTVFWRIFELQVSFSFIRRIEHGAMIDLTEA